MRAAVPLWERAEVRASALEESEWGYRELAEGIADAAFRCTRGGVLLWVSPGLEQVCGRDAEDLLGHLVHEVVDGADHAVLDAALGAGRRPVARAQVRLLGAGGGRPHGVLTLRGGGRGDWIGGWCIVDGAGVGDSPLGAAARDVPAGLAMLDLDRRIVEVNGELCRLLGRDRQELLGRPFEDLLAPGEGAPVVVPVSDDGTVVECRLELADGEVAWVERRVAAVRGQGAVPSHYVAHLLDVTDGVQERERLAREARTDALTELPNRRAADEQLAAMLAHPLREGGLLGVALADLDHLKDVNDGHGHQAGDAAISGAGARIAAELRGSDLVARLGGDEFLLLLPGVESTAHLAALLDGVHRAVEPEFDGPPALHLTLSIGATVATAGEDPREVISRTDRALRRAKQAGRGRTETEPAPSRPSEGSAR